MADLYKVLNLVKLTVSPDVKTATLYTVPPAAETQVGGGSGPVPSPKAVSSVRQTLLTNIVVCDADATGNAATFDITLLSTNSSGDATTTYLFRNSPLTLKTTQILTLNATLSAGDTLVATIATAGAEVDFTVFGIEMITGSGPIA